MRTTAAPTYQVDQGVVTDGVTGLMWQRTPPSEMFRWSRARSYCKGLDLGGHAEWRLPSRLELISLLEYERLVPSEPNTNVATTAIDAAAFPDTPPAEFWSESYYSDSDGDVAWTVSFGTGSLAAQPVDLMVPRTRCVRTARPPTSPHDSVNTRFSRGSKTATDRATGLVWQRELESTNKAVTEAESYCAGLTLDGMNGFRLPHVKELLTIVSATEDGRSASPDVFDVPRSYYSGEVLTSTRAGSQPVPGGRTQEAWFTVDFKERGELAKRTKSEIRCVRDKAGVTPPGPNP